MSVIRVVNKIGGNLPHAIKPGTVLHNKATGSTCIVNQDAKNVTYTDGSVGTLSTATYSRDSIVVVQNATLTLEE